MHRHMKGFSFKCQAHQLRDVITLVRTAENATALLQDGLLNFQAYRKVMDKVRLACELMDVELNLPTEVIL